MLSVTRWNVFSVCMHPYVTLVGNTAQSYLLLAPFCETLIHRPRPENFSECFFSFHFIQLCYLSLISFPQTNFTPLP